jgi:hypothetical protein
MDTLAYPIFSLISAYVMYGYKEVMDGAGERLSHALILIALGVETLYIAHYGLLIMLQKSTEEVPNPSLRDLLYHCVNVVVVLFFLNSGIQITDFVLALRAMVIEGFTGKPDPGGEQVANSLVAMDVLFGISNMVNSVDMKDVSGPLKNTAISLAIVAEVAPQLVGGIMLLMNELIVRTGIALFPLAFYSLLYKNTMDFFSTWFKMMFAASFQMGILVVTISICVKVTAGFLLTLTGFLAAEKLTSGVGGYIVSELQESVIQAGFGITLTALMAWVPSNAAMFAGTMVNAGVTKSGIGMPVTAKEVSARKDISKKDAKAAKVAYQKTQTRSGTQRPSLSAPAISQTSGTPSASNEQNSSQQNDSSKKPAIRPLIDIPTQKPPNAPANNIAPVYIAPIYSLPKGSRPKNKPNNLAYLGLQTRTPNASVRPPLEAAASSNKTPSRYKNPRWNKQDKVLGALKLAEQKNVWETFEKEKNAIKQGIVREFGKLDRSNVARVKFYEQLTETRLTQRKDQALADVLARESVIKQKIAQGITPALVKQGKTPAQINAEVERLYFKQVAANGGANFFARQAQTARTSALHEMAVNATYNTAITAHALHQLGVKAEVQNITSGNALSGATAYAKLGQNAIVINVNRVGTWSNKKVDAHTNAHYGFNAGNSALSTLHHELGHLELALKPTSKLQKLTLSQQLTAGKVSKYAKTNANEFIAEYISGTRSGKQYSKDVHDLFNSYAKSAQTHRLNAPLGSATALSNAVALARPPSATSGMPQGMSGSFNRRPSAAPSLSRSDATSSARARSNVITPTNQTVSLPPRSAANIVQPASVSPAQTLHRSQTSDSIAGKISTGATAALSETTLNKAQAIAGSASPFLKRSPSSSSNSSSSSSSSSSRMNRTNASTLPQPSNATSSAIANHAKPVSRLTAAATLSGSLNDISSQKATAVTHALSSTGKAQAVSIAQSTPFTSNVGPAQDSSASASKNNTSPSRLITDNDKQLAKAHAATHNAKGEPITLSTHTQSRWAKQEQGFADIGKQIVHKKNIEVQLTKERALASKVLSSHNLEGEALESATTALIQENRDKTIKNLMTIEDEVGQSIRKQVVKELSSKTLMGAITVKISPKLHNAIEQETIRRYYEHVTADQGQALFARHQPALKLEGHEAYHTALVGVYNAAVIAQGLQKQGIDARMELRAQQAGAAFAKLGTKTVTINVSAFMVWSNLGGSVATAAANPHFASPHVLGTLHHELAHLELAVHHSSKHQKLTDTQRATAAKVSNYATTNANEFIAEYLSSSRVGIKHSKDVHDLFTHYQSLPSKHLVKSALDRNDYKKIMATPRTKPLNLTPDPVAIAPKSNKKLTLKLRHW